MPGSQPARSSLRTLLARARPTPAGLPAFDAVSARVVNCNLPIGRAPICRDEESFRGDNLTPKIGGAPLRGLFGASRNGSLNPGQLWRLGFLFLAPELRGRSTHR